MSNDTLKLGLYLSPLDVEPCVAETGDLNPSDRCLAPGLVARFMALALQHAGLKYEFKGRSDLLGVFSKNDSTWTGRFGALQRGEIDTITTIASFTKYRNEYFEFTRFFDAVHYVFLIKQDQIKLSQGTMMLINGFRIEVWIAFIVTLLALLASMAFAKWVSGNSIFPDPRTVRRERFQTAKRVSDVLWRAFRFVLLQSDDMNGFRYSHFSINALFVCLSIFTVVFINLYQDVVYNQVDRMAHSVPFRSSEELVNLISTGHLTLLTNAPDEAYFDHVNNSDSTHFKMMRNALNKNPLRSAESLDEVAELLASDQGYVYVCLRYVALRVARNNCDLVIVDVDTPTIWNGFVLRKNMSSRIKKKLDDGIVLVNGRLEYYKQQLEDAYWRKCPIGNGITPLSLSTLSGVFMLYVFFEAVAFFYFAAETMFGLRRRVRNFVIEIKQEIGHEKDTSRKWSMEEATEMRAAASSSSQEKFF